MSKSYSITIPKILGHTRTILVHKWWVFYYSCKLGIPLRGLVHDMSKFSPVEFWESVRFYQGGKSSPIPEAKKIQGYSRAWQHHKGHNPHHYEHWTDNYDSGTTTIKIPYKYVLEMIADYLAAGRTYQGKSFTYDSEYNWWMKKMSEAKMHIHTAAIITNILYDLKEKDGFKNIDWDYKKILYDNL